MKPGLTLESLITRVKKEAAQKAVESDRKKEEARIERQRRVATGQTEPTMYQKEELWYGVGIHRIYEIQTCDCCKGRQVLFDGDRVELRHRLDRSARRWVRERGEAFDGSLPVKVDVVERVIPECWDCFSVERHLTHLFTKGPDSAKRDLQAEKAGHPAEAYRAPEGAEGEAAPAGAGAQPGGENANAS